MNIYYIFFCVGVERWGGMDCVIALRLNKFCVLVFLALPDPDI